MNLTALLLFTACLAAGAGGKAQGITLSEKAAPIRQVFAGIEKQSGYSFMYADRLLQNAKPVTIEVRNASLEQALLLCFKHQPFTYAISDHFIVVKARPQPANEQTELQKPVPPTDITGKVLDSVGMLLAGATVAVKGTSRMTKTDAEGVFGISVSEGDVLVVSFVGYETRSILVTSSMLSSDNNLVVTLKSSVTNLEDIAVMVNTGYQNIPKERVAGSFVQVDNQLLERSVSTSVLDRLRDIVPGLIFNRKGDGISIRGLSTINANAQPLIVLDQFPYDGDIQNINPNDIESVSILKDASAASIWGARAGNGVIVITTKKGKIGGKPRLSFNTSFNFGQKPDLDYVPAMLPAEYIETERRLFNQGYYQAAELSATKTALSPAIEILIKKRDGTISADDAERQLNLLKSYSLNSDIDRYLNQHSVYQQYAFSISGGNEFNQFYISSGFDNNNETATGNRYRRATINASNSYSLFNRRIQVTGNLFYLKSFTDQNNPNLGSLTTLTPYTRLAADDGTALSIDRYRPSVLQAAQQQGLLSWKYSPLEELAVSDNTTSTDEIRLNTGVKFKLIAGLTAEALYQFTNSKADTRNLQGLSSYNTRDLINRFTIVNADGTLTRPVPLGSILDQSEQTLTAHNLRGQLNFEKKWSGHSLAVFGGAELRDQKKHIDRSRLYGYDQEHETARVVDYVSLFKSYVNPASVQNTIPNVDALGLLTDHFYSLYSNLNYTFRNKYVLNVSARLDQSNLFGVTTNQKGVPLYSIGALWNLSDEESYKIAFIPVFRIKASFGYNGNIDRTVSAFTTATYNNGSTTTTRQPYATIDNPPNPELRWERVKIINTGIEFETREARITGSVEYYWKKGIDLIGDQNYPPSSGIVNFRGNNATTKGYGLDLVLNTRNLEGRLGWTTNAFLSFASDKVVAYYRNTTALSYVSGSVYPMIGKPLYSIYSYAWAGLDPNTGNPRGYLDGVISTDYAKMRSAATPENIVHHGSARPLYFGAIRNNLSFSGISLSVNISYRFAYFFKRRSVFYGNTYGLGSHGDYYFRWQKPGDEQLTNVPSMPATANLPRDDFYTYSSALVEPGDNIRLQDIRLAYQVNERVFKRLALRSAQVYLYCNNVGLLWKKTKADIDPDFLSSNPLRTVALGLKVGL